MSYLEPLKNAACKGKQELFFYEGNNKRVVEQAKDICNNQCPVQMECLKYALSINPIPHGIWAGLTRRELVSLAMQNSTICPHCRESFIRKSRLQIFCSRACSRSVVMQSENQRAIRARATEGKI